MAKKYMCSECDYYGKPGWKKRGSLKAETIAWLFFPFGLPYTFWRMLTKERVCPSCRNEYLIDASSTVGLRLQAQKDGLLPPEKKLMDPF